MYFVVLGGRPVWQQVLERSPCDRQKFQPWAWSVSFLEGLQWAPLSALLLDGVQPSGKADSFRGCSRPLSAGPRILPTPSAEMNIHLTSGRKETRACQGTGSRSNHSFIIHPTNIYGAHPTGQCCDASKDRTVSRMMSSLPGSSVLGGGRP